MRKSDLQSASCCQKFLRPFSPDGWQYIAVSTRQPDDIGGMLNYMLYKLDGAFEDGYIYVIEDSSIDLGLLSAIEKNFTKLMEIAADFLDWHYEKMREPASKDPVPVKISVAEAAEKKKAQSDCADAR